MVNVAILRFMRDLPEPPSKTETEVSRLFFVFHFLLCSKYPGTQMFLAHELA